MSRTNAPTKAVLLVAYGAMRLKEFSNTAPLLRLLVAVLQMVVLQMLIDVALLGAIIKLSSTVTRPSFHQRSTDAGTPQA